MIRAARLGYHLTPGPTGYFLRISGPHGEAERYRLDFAPPGGPVPPERIRKGARGHRVWWEQDAGWLLAHPPLRYIRTVRRPFTLWIDDEGHLIDSPERRRGT